MKKEYFKKASRVILCVVLVATLNSCSGSSETENENSKENNLLENFETLNFKTFSQTRVAFGAGLSQTKINTFTLNDDNTNIKSIKMFINLDCPSVGCNIWDVYANISVKDKKTEKWFELGRFITPYGVDTSQLTRGIEIDVTDFKSLLEGQVELKGFIETWGADGWNLSVEFDFEQGIPDYPYYAVSEVMAYNTLSLAGVPYGSSTEGFDLTKSIGIPSNTFSTHLRTVISGWGHATPADSDGRGCAEWCFRTHKILINNEPTFTHELNPIGCGSNKINPQRGNWAPDRAGWCPGMAVPVRVDKFDKANSNNTFNFEYDFEDWVADGGTQSSQTGAYYAISTYVVVKSKTPIQPPVVSN
ncbi:peptide-N-glycosidase F-related protein [Algibacter pectinivorans]|uniref:Peptide-N-glycosidase F, N terminal n=1 Tax=Algibacter pectinivorans TaxID=870482 RepID=A0A1I1PYV4_9FLAO|nr:peptide-N-glycosidase F-related protein [Algibacter pectinivorans]SFD12798.1 Peptide-N-glycosidase F, N terminal [Algibacter pectinivorans]